MGSPHMLVRAMWLMLRQRRTRRALLLTLALLGLVGAVQFIPLPGVDWKHADDRR